MATNNAKVTIDALRKKKQRGEKITRVVLWDYPMACIADRVGVDMILVGDSLGMCVLGYENTLPVTMEDMVHHCKAVTRATDRCFVVGDLPFMSYEASVSQAIKNAGRLIKEGGAHAVKLEGGRRMINQVRGIISAGIPVMAHIGLTPQSINHFGGHKVQGKTEEAAMRLVKDAQILEEAGVFAIVLEGIPWQVAEIITPSISVPTIGISKS